MSPKPRIRPYERADRARVRQICFDTGLMGESIAPVFGAIETFADMFTGYYTEREPDHCFVVELDGKVEGYLVGTLDTRRAWTPAGILTLHTFTRLLPFRPSTYRFMWRGFFDEVVDFCRGVRPGKPDLDRYPAHTHINLMPPARMAPVAGALYRAFVTAAKRAGCPGMHGEVFAENEPASALHRAMGFSPSGEISPVPAIRMNGRRLHLQRWVRAL